MHAIPVIAIFDIGKTNKKLFLFDESYQVVYEQSTKLPEIKDEDGFPCDDIKGIELFITNALQEVASLDAYHLKAVNFTAYGASLVYTDENGEAVTPLYNYLKPYPEELQATFYNTYGGEEHFSMVTASPVLGSLNSGMQLYRLKYEHPQIFSAIKYAMHLPQYLSFLVTGKAVSDITSVGCHTNLWDFTKGEYHNWVAAEQLDSKLAPLIAAETTFDIVLHGTPVKAGIGLHDSSSALIPYLVSFSQPFALLSTGTWCITMNPFNDKPLTEGELRADCLCYMTFASRPVKAARLFAGYEHEVQVGRIADRFKVDVALLPATKFDPALAARLQEQQSLLNTVQDDGAGLKQSVFAQRDMSRFQSATEAYHQLIIDLVEIQVKSADLVINGTGIQNIFVDGGFSHNDIFMQLLARAMPGVELYAASLAQATALGAAMAIHKDWNKQPMPAGLIQMKFIPVSA